MTTCRFVLWSLPIVLTVALPLWAISAWTARRATLDTGRYQTAPVTRGDVIATVLANGTLNPVSVVSVGTQVSGTISKLYVDFNDKVSAGQLLAEIDPAVYRAAVDQTRANLKSARAFLDLARQIELRHQRLLARGLVAQQSLDEAVQRRVAAEAQVAVIEAQLSRDLSNLSYTKIRAPAAGIVLSREVAVGQTVAASFQTPTLFKIAEDLRRMQMECRVVEADVGPLRVGQRVTFTVSALPAREFAGTLHQLRLDPKVEDDVVTYSVIVDVSNIGGELIPGMTALANIVVNERHDVLRVPVVALEFKPSDALMAANGALPEAKTLYVVDGERLKAVAVHTGISDGQYIEIGAAAARPGTLVAIAEKVASAASP